MPHRTTLSRRQVLGGVLGIAALGALAACGDQEPSGPEGAAGLAETPGSERDAAANPDDEIGPDGHFGAIQVASDGTAHLIPLDEIMAGGPPKDGIPSIDRPVFAGPESWDEQRFDDDQFVIGVEVNGKRRAYPFQILVWHELVNDELEGVPLLVSYCPLCGSAIVFVGRIELESGMETVEFGVSGKLYNSDLLMYDRATDSYWSQLTGTAVVGDLTGQRLELYPSELLPWGAWKEIYPDSEVLTRATGFNRDYDNEPYGGYDESSSIWFPVAAEDDRLHEKTRVTGVEISPTIFGAYPDEMVAEFGPINDMLSDAPLLVVANPTAGNNVVVFRRDPGGRSLTFDADGDQLLDRETGTRWTFTGEAVEGELAGTVLDEINTFKGFWFAWFAFHQQTELWLPGEEGS